MIDRLRLVRSALFVPASNPRAIAKARTLGADLVILDLEDAVRSEDKARAREDVGGQLGIGDDRLLAVRVNGLGTAHHDADGAALRDAAVDLVVLPKPFGADDLARFAGTIGKPVIAMIETPAAVLGAAELARVPGIFGLIAGTNDLCAETGIVNEPGRPGLVTALQLMVLAARAAGIAAIDGVYNRLDDPAGFEAEARQGRTWGFDGKALIHPSQVAPANAIFGPLPAELEDAAALVAAAGGGAERFRGRMVEALHVAQARRLLARADLDS